MLSNVTDKLSMKRDIDTCLCNIDFKVSGVLVNNCIGNFLVLNRPLYNAFTLYRISITFLKRK